MAKMLILICSTSIWLEVGDAVMNKTGSMPFIPECKQLKFITVVEEACGRGEKRDDEGRGGALVQKKMRMFLF